jgi:hypothetical protein
MTWRTETNAPPICLLPRSKQMEITPALSAAIEQVLLAKPMLRSLVRGADLPTLPDVIRVFGNDDGAPQMWTAWRAVEGLDVVWVGMQPEGPTGGAAAERVRE